RSRARRRPRPPLRVIRARAERARRRRTRGCGGAGALQGLGLALLVAGDVEVPADVVEAAAGRPAAEPGADLLELRGVERRAEPAEALAVVQAKLGGELVALEQRDVVDAAGERLRRLDLDRAVALEARRRRDQLPDDDVLLQAGQAVDLALERGVGQHLGGLLEGGRRQERVRRQRRLGDAEDDLLEL